MEFESVDDFLTAVAAAGSGYETSALVFTVLNEELKPLANGREELTLFAPVDGAVTVFVEEFFGLPIGTIADDEEALEVLILALTPASFGSDLPAFFIQLFENHLVREKLGVEDLTPPADPVETVANKTITPGELLALGDQAPEVADALPVEVFDAGEGAVFGVNSLILPFDMRNFFFDPAPVVENFGRGGDIIFASQFGDEIRLGKGADTLDAREGDDEGRGGKGDDYLKGSAGDDTLIGGAGDDALVGDEDDDLLDGGAGSDSLDGSAGLDTLIGGRGRDLLLGGDDADDLLGGKGRDQLDGQLGADFLHGGNGRDTLNGGVNDDTLIGGDGADAFVFREVSGLIIPAPDPNDDDAGDDVIRDFNRKDGDTLEFVVDNFGGPDIDLGENDFIEAIDAGLITVTESGGGLLISTGDNSVLLEGLKLGSNLSRFEDSISIEVDDGPVIIGL